MRIKSISIKNFRSLKDCHVEFDNYTALVGANGAGKSNVLCALNVFFRENDGSAVNLYDLDAEDFHGQNVSEPIEITVTFSELSPDAIKDFENYARHGELVITAKAVFNSETGSAAVKQYGERLGIRDFGKFFEMEKDGKSVSDLKSEYAHLRGKYPNLPEEKTKDRMRNSLRQFEEQNYSLCTLSQSGDEFYGFTKGSNRLARYVQWVYVPAVKDATKENIEAKGNALGKILARTVRAKVDFDDEVKRIREETLVKYSAMLDSQQSVLEQISASITEKLNRFAHPGVSARLAWTEDTKKSVQIEPPFAKIFATEGSFAGEIARFGHGLQRSYLLALLQELSTYKDLDQPTLLLACEEPELYQHPPQARHLSSVFRDLSYNNAQVVVTTHSPYFVSGAEFPNVRVVRRNSSTNDTTINAVSFAQLAKQISAVTTGPTRTRKVQEVRLFQALQTQLNEMFFTPKVLFVEGIEDLAYLTSWFVMTGDWDILRACGVHIIPVHSKSNLLEPIAIAQLFSIPTFVVFDSDSDCDASKRGLHEKDNKELLRILGGDDSSPFPEDTVWRENFVQWPNNILAAIKSDLGPTRWDQIAGRAGKFLHGERGSYTKNPMFISKLMEEVYAECSHPESMVRLAEQVKRFAEK